MHDPRARGPHGGRQLRLYFVEVYLYFVEVCWCGGRTEVVGGGGAISFECDPLFVPHTHCVWHNVTVPAVSADPAFLAAKQSYRKHNMEAKVAHDCRD